MRTDTESRKVNRVQETIDRRICMSKTRTKKELLAVLICVEAIAVTAVCFNIWPDQKAFPLLILAEAAATFFALLSLKKELSNPGRDDEPVSSEESIAISEERAALEEERASIEDLRQMLEEEKTRLEQIKADAETGSGADSDELEKLRAELEEEREIREELADEIDAKTEEILRQQVMIGSALQVANDVSKARSEFVTTISHDIRTPMNAIIGFTNLALKDEGLSEETRSYLAKVSRASDHMQAMLEELLESGKSQVEKEYEKPTNVRKLMEGLCTYAKEDTDRRKQIFSIDTTGIRERDVILDPIRLNQVIQNAFADVQKSTPEYGKLMISVREDEVPGMDRKEYDFYISSDRIYEDADPETDSSMTVTRNLAELMGGTVEVQNEGSAGLCMTVTIPFREIGEEKEEEAAEAASPEAYSIDESRFHGAHVLVVEDFELNMDITQKILSDHGMIPDGAENGQIALDKISGSPAGTYDMVLMDVEMPVMDGLEATRRIRDLDDPKLANIPIVAMTANAFAEDKASALEAGMDGYIAKPISPDKLLATMESHMPRTLGNH
ncbi:MAG: response regulator [Lachnospiraceae bacterium]|nr:response regulator [Lachnospiraceae bacterium]